MIRSLFNHSHCSTRSLERSGRLYQKAHIKPAYPAFILVDLLTIDATGGIKTGNTSTIWLWVDETRQ